MTNVEIGNRLHFVRHIARSLCRRLPSKVQFDEMVAAGCLGLVEAGARFDPKRGVEFEAYAGPRVRGAMMDALRSSCASSRGFRQRARRVMGCHAVLISKLGRAPEREELEEALGRDANYLDEAPVLRLVALDGVGPSKGEQASLEDKLEAGLPSPLETLVHEQTQKILLDALDRLNDRHRLVLSLSYFEELNLKEIGEVMGVTESRVCQIRQEALRLLRVLLVELD